MITRSDEVRFPHGYPNGITAKGFIQKDVSTAVPAWLKRVEAPTKGGGGRRRGGGR